MRYLVIIDVDGVMTNGVKLYDASGAVIAKGFCDQDFTAIKRFQQDGYQVCWLTADRNINEAIAKNRNIEFCYARNDDGQIDKVYWLHKLMEQYKLNNVIYIGDDLFDIPIIKAVNRLKGITFSPANAAPQVRAATTHRLVTKGGEGAIMEMYSRLSNCSDPPTE